MGTWRESRSSCVPVSSPPELTSVPRTHKQLGMVSPELTLTYASTAGSVSSEADILMGVEAAIVIPPPSLDGKRF